MLCQLAYRAGLSCWVSLPKSFDIRVVQVWDWGHTELVDTADAWIPRVRCRHKLVIVFVWTRAMVPLAVGKVAISMVVVGMGLSCWTHMSKC